MKKILFRADAKPSIGIGDLMSFVHLCEYFRNSGWEIHFAVKNYEAALNIIESHCLKNVLIIDHKDDIQREIISMNNYIELNRIDALFIQVNERKLAEYDELSGDLFKACVYFDYDLPSGYDLVLSWDVDSEKYFDLSMHRETVFFIGYQYVILPSAFDRKIIDKRRYREKNESLLIAMGGADEFDLTCGIIEKLVSDELNEMTVTVAVGAGYQGLVRLEKLLEKAEFRSSLKVDVKDMFTEYIGCDVAIGAGGLTSSEMVASGTPCFLIAAYEHQIIRCKFFETMGWAKYLGFQRIGGIDRYDLMNFRINSKKNFDIKIIEVFDYMDRVLS